MSERKKLIEVLSKYAKPGVSKSAIKDDVAELLSKARIIDRCNLRRCNDEMSDEAAERNDARDEAATKRICLILGENYDDRIQLEENGDPRGYPVQLKLPDGERNTWGNTYGFGGE